MEENHVVFMNYSSTYEVLKMENQAHKSYRCNGRV